MKNLAKMVKRFKPSESPVWLPRDYSKALVVCVGAGPWRFERRRLVQKKALKWLGNRDISEIRGEVDIFPLDWENKIIENLAKNLRKKGLTFKKFCKKMINGDFSNKKLYRMCGKSDYMKTLSLFCRDSLRKNSFTIDRHVKRILNEYKMPPREDEMIKICLKNGLSPNKVSFGLVKTRIDRGNPDWSRYG